MYATRTRQARPEPFAVHVGIGERLGLAHMDWPLTIAALGLIAFSVLLLIITLRPTGLFGVARRTKV